MKTKAQSKSVRLLEQTQAGPRKRDQREPIVRNCKILGFESTRGRKYLPNALRGAVKLYEGCPVYLDHPDRDKIDEPRSVRDKFGWFTNVRFVEGDGLRGDFHYNPCHPFARTFEAWVDEAPGQVGFSHNADGRLQHDGMGNTTVVEIPRVHSVDLVGRGATTQGLFESHTGACMEDQIDTTGTGTAPVTEDTTGGMDYASHCAEMVKAIMQDTSLSPEAKKKKILKALELCEDEETTTEAEDASKEGETPEQPGEGDTERYEEAARLVKSTDPNVKLVLEGFDRLATERRTRLMESHCRKLCSDAKLPPIVVTDLFLQTLLEARDDGHRTRLIEDRRTIASADRTPRSQPPARAGAGKKLTVDDLLAGVS